MASPRPPAGYIPAGGPATRARRRDGSGTARAGSRASWEVLTRARLEALASLYPGWRIWLDQNGWHARRRDGYVQDYRPGAPSFSVHAGSATGLAAQLCWQQAAEAHAPNGCEQQPVRVRAG